LKPTRARDAALGRWMRNAGSTARAHSHRARAAYRPNLANDRFTACVAGNEVPRTVDLFFFARVPGQGPNMLARVAPSGASHGPAQFERSGRMHRPCPVLARAVASRFVAPRTSRLPSGAGMVVWPVTQPPPSNAFEPVSAIKTFHSGSPERCCVVRRSPTSGATSICARPRAVSQVRASGVVKAVVREGAR